MSTAAQRRNAALHGSVSVGTGVPNIGRHLGRGANHEGRSVLPGIEPDRIGATTTAPKVLSHVIGTDPDPWDIAPWLRSPLPAVDDAGPTSKGDSATTHG